MKIISRILLILSLLFLPFMFIGGLFGLTGSDATYFVIIWIGYISLIISSTICQFRYKFFPFVIISIIAIIIGATLDTNFWKNENNNLCQELRSNPTCVEDECGFTCSDVGGVGLVTSYNICRDKKPKLCAEKMAKYSRPKKKYKMF